MKAKLPKQQKQMLYSYQVASTGTSGRETDPTNTIYVTTTHFGKR